MYTFRELKKACKNRANHPDGVAQVSTGKKIL